MFTVETVSSYEELLRATGDTSPYDFRSIFQPQGTFGKRRERQRFKLLKNLDLRVREILEDGERVVCVCSGMRNSPWTQAFVGWIVYYMNSRALVLTDRRLLVFQTTARNRPGEFIKQIRFDAIEYARKRGFFGLFRIRTRNRKFVDFVRIPGSDMRRLATMLTTAVDTAQVAPGKTGGIQNLCPECTQPVAAFPPACANCGQPFKRPLAAGGLSLVFPGLGDLYLGHYLLGALEAMVALFVWITVLVPAPNSDTPMPIWAEIFGAAIVLIPLIHLPDALGTYLVARKGLIPARKSKATGFGVTELKRNA